MKINELLQSIAFTGMLLVAQSLSAKEKTYGGMGIFTRDFMPGNHAPRRPLCRVPSHPDSRRPYLDRFQPG